ncbi:MAG TPA: ABC transporter substrate-binding protein, partial [Acidimicrobiales bacterium]|nr:ABC transporter substrate-binding protein [Acidimicrobiales bacterium]
AVDAYTVAYNLVIPFSAFPISIAEQQISYMAHPSSFSPTFTGNPIGTGPFMVKSWQVGVESQFVRNPNYWRSDAHNRQLPYLGGINFKTIVDNSSRNQALQSGSVDMILQQDGTEIAALKKMKNVSYVTDINAPVDPAVNCLIFNTTATLNQYFCWAGEFASIGVPGTLQYLLKGQAAPAAVQDADWVGTQGAVNPSTLQWDTSLKPVVNDVNIRRACAMAINRNTYFKVVDSKVGSVADGIFRKTSPFYKNPGWPAYNPKKAKALVDAYKAAHNVSEVGFCIETVSGSSSSLQAFSLFQQQLKAVGITVTPRPSVQSTLINNVIYGEFDCSEWNQFGGVDPSLNYVWFISLNATASPAVGGLGMNALPAGTYIAGAVNFAHQGDSTIENSMLAALASKPGSAAEKKAWQTVNSQFAKIVPYVWIDSLVNAWAARSTVQNWVSGTAGDGTTPVLSPDGGAARWDQIWKS